MKESFDEYKKTIESNISSISFLYNGDVISSINSKYSELLKSDSVSPSFIIRTIENIYKESFKMLTEKCEKILIPKESILNNNGDILDFIYDKLKLYPIYIFASDGVRELFDSISIRSKRMRNIHSLPSYFYSIEKYSNVRGSVDLEIFDLPESEDDVLYLVDSGIQSLVYSIQNMTYDVEKIDDKYKHTINYSLYDCDYKSYKLIIKDLSFIREEKINKILNGN